jgi:hypothetical protein
LFLGSELRLVSTAGDGCELVHQLDKCNAGIAAIAAILIDLHLGGHTRPLDDKPV